MISVVLPAYNEQGAVAATLAELKTTLEAAVLTPLELVVVDDGSTDGTGAAAEAAGARVITHPQNIGYGRSLKDGIRAAQYDTIVICDADGSYPAEEIPAMVAEHRRGIQMVVGARRAVGHSEGLFKGAMRFVLKSLVEFTAGRNIPDVNSGLRVFSKAEVTPYFRHLSDRFSFTTSQTLAYLLSHRTVLYRPIAYRPRIGKSKVNLFRDSLRTLQYISQAILIYNPIKLFLVLAAVAGLLGVGCLALGLFSPWRAGLECAVASALTSLLLVGLGFVTDTVRMLLGSRE